MWQHVPGWQVAVRRALETLVATGDPPRVARLVAPPGFGKTHVVESVRAGPDGHRIIRLCARTSYRGVRVLEELRRFLGLGSLGGEVEGRITVVAAALRQQDVRVIVIDDAAYISRGLVNTVAMLPTLCAQAGCSVVLCAAYPTDALLPCSELDAALAMGSREALVPGYGGGDVTEPPSDMALRAPLEALAGQLVLGGAQGLWPLPDAASRVVDALLDRPDGELAARARGALVEMAGDLVAAGVTRRGMSPLWRTLGFTVEEWQWLGVLHHRARFGGS